MRSRSNSNLPSSMGWTWRRKKSLSWGRKTSLSFSKHCISRSRWFLTVSVTVCSWPYSCNWQASLAISQVLSWAFAIAISRSLCSLTLKGTSSLEGWLELHSSIPKDTLERKKRSYFSLWLFRHTESFDLTANNGTSNEFRIPDVPDESCLLLCPHLNLLTLIFSDQTFAAPELTSSEQLFHLRIPPGQK